MTSGRRTFSILLSFAAFLGVEPSNASESWAWLKMGRLGGQTNEYLSYRTPYQLCASGFPFRGWLNDLGRRTFSILLSFAAFLGVEPSNASESWAWLKMGRLGGQTNEYLSHRRPYQLCASVGFPFRG